MDGRCPYCRTPNCSHKFPKDTAVSESPSLTGLPAPSSLFEDILVDSGTIVATCEFCGRTHFATASEGHFDEGELEGLREKALKNPEMYFEYPEYDSISYGHIAGNQAVVPCDCNHLRKYENFIWEHRGLITQYLIKRTEQERKDAEMEAQQTAPLKEVAG